MNILHDSFNIEQIYFETTQFLYKLYTYCFLSEPLNVYQKAATWKQMRKTLQTKGHTIRRCQAIWIFQTNQEGRDGKAQL